MENKPDKKDDTNIMLRKDIVESLILNYIKLLSKFFNLYTNMPEWSTFPTKEELKDEQMKNKIKAKINITLNILYKAAKKANDEEIAHLVQYNHKILEDPNVFTKIAKLNIIIGCGMTLIKIVPVKFNKKEIENLMVQYLKTIITNFYLSYNNTIYAFLESICQSLTEINHCKFFFDYELVFLYEKEYFVNQIIPKIKEETSRLILTFNEDLITEFGLYEIDYNNINSVLYYGNFLLEAKKFKQYQKEHSKEEYQQYKKEIKEKLLKNSKIK